METEKTNNIAELMDFVEETRQGYFSTESVELDNVLKYTIKRDDVFVIEELADNRCETILYGLY